MNELTKFLCVHTHTHTGLIVLLGSGVHTVWAFWRMYEPNSYESIIAQDFVVVASWYVATIIGTLFAAYFVSTWTKKQLYVRLIRTHNYATVIKCILISLPSPE